MNQFEKLAVGHRFAGRRHVVRLHQHEQQQEDEAVPQRRP